MRSPSLDSGPIRSPRGAGNESRSANTSERAHRRAIRTRLTVSGLCAALLSVLLMWVPNMAPVWPVSTSPAAALASRALSTIDVTAVLTVLAALTVVALVRKLPYGIGVVIACVVGAEVTTALVRHLAASSTTATDLPSGQLVAVTALLGAASMVASATWRPMILGLGTVAALAVGAAQLVVGSVSPVGIVSALLITGMWWPACSVVMLFSPAAAAREARNPFDTAALVAQRRMGRFR